MSEVRDPVAVYKEHLRALIDRRPSGTRRKLAEAFGTHPSFISQITNPALRVPLPAQHIPALFRICHFSPEEQRRFLGLYSHAHPGQPDSSDPAAESDEELVQIRIGGLAPQRREEVAALIREFAARVIALARRPDPPPLSAKDADQDAKELCDEKADQRNQ
ncbi:MAG: hypothetical protein AAFR46_06530 [Pseudomonadota bacterium]